jgi:2,3-dihydroxybenzoate-AMP ligase
MNALAPGTKFNLREGDAMVLEGVNAFPEDFIRTYYEKGWWTGMTMGEMLDRSCELFRDRQALVAGDVRLTYGQLKTITDRAAIAFINLGIRRTDRVLLQVPNWAEFVYAYYGLHKMGGIPVMCIPRLSQREIEHFCQLTGAETWVVPNRFEKIDYVSMFGPIRSNRPGLKRIVVIEAPGAGADRVPEGTHSFRRLLDEADHANYPADYLTPFKPQAQEVCHFMPTGGTTGLPKLVPRTHNEYLCNITFRAHAWMRTPDDITLIATPVTHNMGIEASLNPTFLTGGKVVMITSTRAKDILEAIQKERITTMILVPAQLQQIIDFPELHRFDLSSLKVIAGAGSHVAADLTRKVHEKLGCRFYNVFGMSEGPCTQTRWDDPEPAIAHTVGWPICPHDEFKVIDEEGREVPGGTEGELVARGPCIFRGYYQAEATNREVFTRDGFFRTGDLARFDPENRIMITGRKKDIIIRGGENISAAEVEELICLHPKVELAAVVGMPDPILGERACAFVKTRGGVALFLEEIVSFFREQKASVLLFPERLELVQDLPYTNVGKVDKKRLREEVAKKLNASK